VRLLDNNPTFLSLAQRLGGGSFPGVQPERADLASATPASADLVVASYALAELPPDRQAGVVSTLWAATTGLLALVEPGAPAGFERLKTARAALIAERAEILAPCPHERACPMESPDWCHFRIRLPRTRDHRLAKGAEVPFEDEPFAYLLAARPGLGQAAAARVLGSPRAGKVGVDLRLCTPDGLQLRHVPRRDKAAHALARRLDWGDALD
jgi:ribosomal protein RSM22 (predicted rRNA methylase)